MAVMAGAEAGWAAACAESRPLREAMSDEVEDPLALRHRYAVSHFGTNGLRLVDWRATDSWFGATIEDLPPSRLNQCMQALVWCSEILPEVEYFQVSVVGAAAPAIEVARYPLQETYRLWWLARPWFSVMPMSVFLAVNTAARLKIEPAEDAARAAAWLALNDAILALDLPTDVETTGSGEFVELGRRCRVAAEGARLSVRLTGNSGASVLHKVVRLLEQAAAAAQSGNPPRIRKCYDRLFALFDTLEPVPVLPSLEPPDTERRSAGHRELRGNN
jgi:hypothetical protein